MSWLQKALQRAMESHKDDGIDLLNQPENAPESSIRSAQKTQIGPDSSHPPLTMSISYTKTQLKRMDEKTMLKNRLIIPDMCDVPLIESYKTLKAKILKRAEENKWRTIMVTSPCKGEGKTVTAINLAMVIAQETNQTVLLADTDMRNPSVLKMFGIKESNGLCDFFLNDMPITNLLVNPGIDRFTILPGGKPVANTAEILRSHKMASLVKEMKDRYSDRYIIFDLPPLLMCTDPLVFSKYVDATVIVVEAGKTSKKDLKRGWDLLDGENILGIVLNKSKQNKNSQYYKYKLHN